MITAQKFHAYVDVQKSGETNMFDVRMVCALSGILEREDCLDIMKNYEKYLVDFGSDDK